MYADTTNGLTWRATINNNWDKSGCLKKKTSGDVYYNKTSNLNQNSADHAICKV